MADHAQAVVRAYPEYHAAPVGAWGAHRPSVLVVGLAPGLHGAARTGRAFVGDASGTFLFAALYRAALATSPDPQAARLRHTQITNVVKCLPPNNQPRAAELNACRSHLQQEIQAFAPQRGRRPRVLLALGGLAYASVRKALELPRGPFVHGETEWHASRSLHVVGSYHPSRLNVNTRRLTETMFDGVLHRVRDLAELSKLE